MMTNTSGFSVAPRSLFPHLSQLLISSFWYYPLWLSPQSPLHQLTAPLSHFLFISSLTFNHQFISLVSGNRRTNECVLSVPPKRAKHKKYLTHTQTHTQSICASPSGSGSKTQGPSPSVCFSMSPKNTGIYPLFILTCVNSGSIEVRWIFTCVCACVLAQKRWICNIITLCFCPKRLNGEEILLWLPFLFRLIFILIMKMKWDKTHIAINYIPIDGNNFIIKWWLIV